MSDSSGLRLPAPCRVLGVKPGLDGMASGDRRIGGQCLSVGYG